MPPAHVSLVVHALPSATAHDPLRHTTRSVTRASRSVVLPVASARGGVAEVIGADVAVAAVLLSAHTLASLHARNIRTRLYKAKISCGYPIAARIQFALVGQVAGRIVEAVATPASHLVA